MEDLHGGERTRRLACNQKAGCQVHESFSEKARVSNRSNYHRSHGEHHYRELSKGHFSADNHLQLNNLNVDVPIYRAKLSGEDRIIVLTLSGYMYVDH
jgi:hypothetical protein